MPLTAATDHKHPISGSASRERPFFEVPQCLVEQIEALYDQGLCLKAYDLAQSIGPLKLWGNTPARKMAGRLAANLGGYRLANVLHWLAWRSNRNDPDLLAYHGHTLLQRRGPLLAYETIQRYGASKEGCPDAQVHLATLKATVAAHFRDFQTAHDHLQHASELLPDHPWLATASCHVLEVEDRYDEALQAARRALELRPWYRPGIQAVAHMLQLLDRDDEALVLLREACARIENAHVARQLAGLEVEMADYDDALVTLDRFAQLCPLMEKAERAWLERQRVTVHCLRNDWVTALAEAKRIADPYYQELAKRLEDGKATRRVKLEVPFVRQHHLTCAPATLSAISRFWNQPAAHLEVAEAICYDGTPAHSERHWAETHGWHTREFTVTWEAAMALLDHGVPFTLTTVGATNAHLQAVIGYDLARQTLWIRDPFVYYTGEVMAEPFLHGQRSTGPRGMALVPQDKRELLEGLQLPDAGLWDQLHAIDRALALHCRHEALQKIEQMEAAAPQHRLTLCAGRVLASYDANTPALLASFNALLDQFPDDEPLTLAKLGCLRELARRPQRLDLLEQLCSKRALDPVFWQQYAQELRLDGRESAPALSWIRWALRYRPADAICISTWADLLWDIGKFEQATQLYRLAACLADKNEGLSRSYFLACSHTGRTEAGLAFLRSRALRLGEKASGPAMTLVGSLQHLRRTEEALGAADEALMRRPNDGALLLFAADLYARHGRFEAANKLLREAEGVSSASAWHRAAAAIAGFQNAKQEALRHWREVLKLEPLAHDAMEAVTLLLAETDGNQAALTFLDKKCEEFPFSCPVLSLRIRWLSDAGPGAVIPHLRQLLEVNPADAWAARELALELSGCGQHQEALAVANEAVRIEPQASAGYSVRAQVHLQQGQLSNARDGFRQAIQREVDNVYAVEQYVSTAPSFAERKNALVEVAQELRRQVIFSDALNAYRDAARGLLPAEEVLGLLRGAHQARPDLWQAWSVLIQQLTDMGKHDEALALAGQATSRFPLLPGGWADLARVEQARLNDSAEIAALVKALELNPHFALASRRLADIFQRQHKLDSARTTLEQAVAANPLEPANHACLAEILWRLGERDMAIARARHAILLNPGYQWPWSLLADWGPEANQPGLATEIARELTRSRPNEARSWVLLARALMQDALGEELFAALDRAVTLNPRSEEAYDLRARALAKLNRFDEALVQCEPSALKPVPPTLLLRAAWLEAERGNVARAIARAKAVLTEHPDRYGGWQMLADWCVRSGQLDAAIPAAEKMAALAPLEPVPLGYLGDLKLRSGDQEGARMVFERAFTLDPNYSYAGGQLFHMHLKARRFEDAARILGILRRSGETVQTLYCGICLGAEQEDFGTALPLFEHLCKHEQVDVEALERAAAALDDRGPRRNVNDCVKRCLEQADCLPTLAAFWVSRQVRNGKWNLHKRISRFNGEPKRLAVFAWLHEAGERLTRAKNSRDFTISIYMRYHFHLLMHEHSSWLRKNDEGWARVGYVLTCIGKPKSVVKWLGDWRERKDPPSWALYNLMLMLQRLSRYDECRAVACRALKLRHVDDQSYGDFCITAAFEEATAGNAEHARQLLETIPPDTTPERHQALRRMTELLIEIRPDANVPDKAAKRKEIRQELGKIFSTYRPCQTEKYVRKAYYRFLAASSTRVGSFGLWGTWFYRGSRWLEYPLIALVLPAVFFVPAAIIPLVIGLYAFHKKDKR